MPLPDTFAQVAAKKPPFKVNRTGQAGAQPDTSYLSASLSLYLQGFACECGGDLLTVKASVFYKNFAGGVSADDHSCQIDARDITLESFGIERWSVGLIVQ